MLMRLDRLTGDFVRVPSMSGTERSLAFRSRQRARLGLPDPVPREQRPPRKSLPPRAIPLHERPFVGCDGEGAGRGHRHRYTLFRMGQAELFANDRELTTEELLGFICDEGQAQGDVIFCGFSFGYDVTMILRDMPDAKLRYALGVRGRRRDGKQESVPVTRGESRWVTYAGFGIHYLPRNYLAVVRRKPAGTDSRGRTRWVKDPMQRTTYIYESFGFFQRGFVGVLQKYGIGREHWPLIQRMKNQRAQFGRMTKAHRRYNQLECELLAEVMERFRANAIRADILPREYSGAGKLAAAMHKEGGTLTRAEVESLVPADVLAFADRAFYGGRMETTRVGLLRSCVWNYDINSAYPDQMQRLPCLAHGRWRKRTGRELAQLPDGETYVANVAYQLDVAGGRTSRNQPLGGFPFRLTTGRLVYPLAGRGTYWSVEIRAAQRFGVRVLHGPGWHLERTCDCQPFAWVPGRYAKRLELGKGDEGEPLKFGLASLYGKLAQRVGTARWRNLIWGGLITAGTRAQLLDAAGQAPGEIVMLATDGIYSTVPLDLPLSGHELGRWTLTPHERLTIVMPGVYWPPSLELKTRGLPRDFFRSAQLATSRSSDGAVVTTGPLWRAFEGAWRRFSKRYAAAGGTPPKAAWPIVYASLDMFVSLRLALHLTAGLERGIETPGAIQPGTWRRQEKGLAFWPFIKRSGGMWEPDGSFRTFPLAGSVTETSAPYDRTDIAREADAFDLARLELDDQPEPIAGLTAGMLA
jgi:hypothetical protein